LDNNVAARESFERAVALSPDANSLTGLAFVAKQEEALELYRRVLALDASDASAQSNLALLLCRLGRWEEAFSTAKVLIRMRPDDALALEVFVRSAVNSGRDEEAFSVAGDVQRLADKLRGRKDEYRTYEARGHLALARGHWAEAEGHYEKANELHAWCCLVVGAGRAAFARGDRTKADAMYAKACATNKCDSRCALITMLASALRGEGERENDDRPLTHRHPPPRDPG
jgi:tetratricopeptide (TPR) repeat protein